MLISHACVKLINLNYFIFFIIILTIISIFAVGNSSAKFLNIKVMIKQKMISFKIDEDNLPLLDSLCYEYGLKRNTMLNVLVRTGISCLLDKKAKFAVLAALQSVVFK